MSNHSDFAETVHAYIRVTSTSLDQRRATIRYVLQRATSVADARHLLDVLGLDPQEALDRRDDPQVVDRTTRLAGMDEPTGYP